MCDECYITDREKLLNETGWALAPFIKGTDNTVIFRITDRGFFILESSLLRQMARPSSSQRTWYAWSDSRRLCTVSFTAERTPRDGHGKWCSSGFFSSTCHPQWRRLFPTSLSLPSASAGSCTPSLSTHSTSEKAMSKERSVKSVKAESCDILIVRSLKWLFHPSCSSSASQQP